MLIRFSIYGVVQQLLQICCATYMPPEIVISEGLSINLNYKSKHAIHPNVSVHIYKYVHLIIYLYFVGLD